MVVAVVVFGMHLLQLTKVESSLWCVVVCWMSALYECPISYPSFFVVLYDRSEIEWVLIAWEEKGIRRKVLE